MPLEINAAAFARPNKAEGKERTIGLSITGIKPMLAMPAHRDISPLTVQSLMATQEALLTRGISYVWQCAAGSSLVHHARSKLAWDFLQSDCDRLFWQDSDVVWGADDALRILALSTKMPVVHAAYPAKHEPIQFYMNTNDRGEIVEANEYGCLPLKTGLGFCCVSREVIETLSARAPRRRFPGSDEPIPYLFRLDDEVEGDAEGEDIAFLTDAYAAGFGVWVDPNITLGHVGSKTYRASLSDYLVASPIKEHAVASDAA